MSCGLRTRRSGACVAELVRTPDSRHNMVQHSVVVSVSWFPDRSNRGGGWARYFARNGLNVPCRALYLLVWSEWRGSSNHKGRPAQDRRQGQARPHRAHGLDGESLCRRSVSNHGFSTEAGGGGGDSSMACFTSCHAPGCFRGNGNPRQRRQVAVDAALPYIALHKLRTGKKSKKVKKKLKIHLQVQHGRLSPHEPSLHGPNDVSRDKMHAVWRACCHSIGGSRSPKACPRAATLPTQGPQRKSDSTPKLDPAPAQLDDLVFGSRGCCLLGKLPGCPGLRGTSNSAWACFKVSSGELWPSDHGEGRCDCRVLGFDFAIGPCASLVLDKENERDVSGTLRVQRCWTRGGRAAVAVGSLCTEPSRSTCRSSVRRASVPGTERTMIVALKRAGGALKTGQATRQPSSDRLATAGGSMPCAIPPPLPPLRVSRPASSDLQCPAQRRRARDHGDPRSRLSLKVSTGRGQPPGPITTSSG